MADIINSNSNSLIAGTAGDDSIINRYDTSNVTIEAFGGNDTITNWDSSNVTINAGDGDDSIDNRSDSVIINTDDGNDFIHNFYSGEHGKYVTINGGTGNDYITNDNDSVTINAGDGDDSIHNNGDSVTIDGGNGDDSIRNRDGASVTIDGGDGNDTIHGYANSNSKINGDSGNDYIDVTTFGGSVIDTNENWDVVPKLTVNAGVGDDQINYSEYFRNNFTQYTEGDGHDTVWGYGEKSSLQINSSVGWSSVVSGNNIVVTVGDGSITLVDAATSSGVNINGVTYPIDTTATTPADTSTATTPADTSTATTPADTSTATTPADTSTATTPADTSTATTPADTSTATTPADTSTATTPADTSTATTPADTSTATTPADTSTATTPADTSTATTPADTLPPAVGGAAYDIVFFVDVSGSMETYINQVNAIAQTFVDKLKERGITDYRLAVVDYETAFNVYFGADGSPFTQDVDTFKSWMAQAAEKSKSNLANENALYAINHVLNNFPFNPTANKEFIVLTDENFTDDGYPESFGGNIFDFAVTEQFMAANDVQLDVIGRVDGSCDSAWTPVARNTGGNFYDINGNYTETFNEIVLNLDCVNVNLATVPDGQTGWFFVVPGNHVTDLKSVDAIFVNANDPNLEGYTQLYGQPVGAVTADKVYSGNMSSYRQNITIPDMWNVTGTSHADILNVAGTGFGVVIASGDGHDAVKLGEAATGIILTDHDLKNDGLEFAARQALGTFTENVATDLVTLTNQVALTSPTMAVYLQNFSSPLQEEFDAKNEQFMAYGVTNGGTTNTVYDLLFGTEPTPEPPVDPVEPVIPPQPPIANDTLEGRIMFAQWGYGFTPTKDNPLYGATTAATTDTTSAITTETLATSADLVENFGSPTLDEISPANFAVTQDDFTAQNFNALDTNVTQMILASNKFNV